MRIKKKIRAFCGFEGSGKSYNSRRLLTTMGYQKISFADPLRKIAFQVIGIPYEEGMRKYAELKKTELINGLTFRNILENLGASVREFDEEFWANAALRIIKNTPKNVCIDDLRYYNEYELLKNFAEANDIDFKLVFCDFHSPSYVQTNPHESAALAGYLKNLGYKDQQYVEDIDMQTFHALESIPKPKFD